MRVIHSALGDRVLLTRDGGTIVETFTAEGARALARLLLDAADYAERRDRELREAWAVARKGKAEDDT